ncbi:dimethylamine monooxygenase subunit DmmA family protein [Bacillus sp. EB600]|uniref:dimethylamine monooxygenase subunit DmmA family protein n=1 Tax=Bacillus sp. EB600 TaxID=2806345 RepID=UPI00210BBB54|nr:dimethylamine monooxygenase subunit DmmA family protein [Bacillus sp. EB600]MCQ6281199.1 hypothetical protein [Bacillus sp. EB600]
MKSFKCKLINEERTLEQGYIADVKLEEGTIPQMIGFADKVQCNDATFHLPIQVIETCKKERKYRLFFNTSAMQEQKHLHLVEQIRSQIFELNFLEYPFFRLQPNCRKMLFLIDESVLFESLTFIDLHSINNIETIIYVKTDRQQEEILDHLQHIPQYKINLLPTIENEKIHAIFKEQKIGTKIFISGPWSMIYHIKDIANTVGFTDDEIQYNGFGQKDHKVYCVKCYSYNKMSNNKVITCEHCKVVLDVSNHFSKRLEAYLGYIQVI